MILLAVILGFYAIGSAGYYKLTSSMMRESAPDIVAYYPTLHRILLVVMSLVWPVLTYWSLAKEAAK